MPRRLKLTSMKFCRTLDRNLSSVFKQITYGRQLIWQDELSGEQYSLLKRGPPPDPRAGAKRVRQHIELALTKDSEVFGVLCHGTFNATGKKSRSYFDQQSLLVLKLDDSPEGVVARIVGEISVEDVIAGKVSTSVTRRLSAIDDLEQPPEGRDAPLKKAIEAEIYIRDAMVREYVKRRAKGFCEFCNERGFLLGNGSHYLEAHHILELAEDGPDTIENVIALCASHHREAHYGEQREFLNRQFRKILQEKV